MMQRSHPPIEEKRDVLKKRSIIILLIAGLIVVLAIGLAGGFFFTSPIGQVWEHDWIANPTGLTAVATVLAAIATFCAVLVALFGMRNERIKAQEDRKEAREQFQTEQKRARAAQEESQRQFLEAQYAASRPLLVPLAWEPNDFIDTPPMVIKWNDGQQTIGLKNVGTGIATNVWAVLMPPETTQMQSTGFQYSRRLRSHLLSGESAHTEFRKGGTIFNCDDKIGKHTLCLPRERENEANFNAMDRRDRYIARLTITCSDIFGRKHASIFDYTDKGLWIDVDFIQGIEHDLGEMGEAKGIKSNPSSIPPSINQTSV